MKIVTMTIMPSRKAELTVYLYFSGWKLEEYPFSIQFFGGNAEPVIGFEPCESGEGLRITGENLVCGSSMTDYTGPNLSTLMGWNPYLPYRVSAVPSEEGKVEFHLDRPAPYTIVSLIPPIEMAKLIEQRRWVELVTLFQPGLTEHLWDLM